MSTKSPDMYHKAILILGFGFLSLMACTATRADNNGSVLQASAEQLRGSIGRWDVTTEFLTEDGTPAKTVSGSYEFSWVIPDRVVSGTSENPELKQVSAILFYVNEAKQKIEMVSVGADGNLWVMTGELGGEVRTTPEFKTASGGTGQLRFTRYSVLVDSFESKMEYTEDGGETWLPGNHQVFLRATLESSD